ncbi:MAG: tRNA1Val (adenine37-N6)-methyltransferase [Bacteroidetes bacterium]|nr:MAG: tRNA1Val (adenine37-N6)-methyltransferase [Bacteroidota bacterium]
MSSNTFAFKQFTVRQDKCAMKVGTDAVLLGAWVNTGGIKNILDIGTGTGIIALMLAQKSTAQVEAIDIDEVACIQARENVMESPWHERVSVHQFALQDFAARAGKKFDLIVSNPPYFVDSSKASEEARSKARHADLLPPEALLDGVAKLLDKEGKFCVILPVKEGEAFRELAPGKKLFLNKLVRIKTTPEKSEKRLMMQFGFMQKTFSETTLIIEKDNLNEQHYTDEYRILTKDYYLYF